MLVLATHDGLRPILISGNHKNFLAGLTLLSESCLKRNVHPEDFAVEEVEKIALDPGGMLNTKEPWLDIEAPCGARFIIQASKSYYVLQQLLQAEGKSTKVPGWRRFLNFHSTVAIPEATYDYLCDVVEKISKSDNAIHAALDYEKALDELARDGHIVRVHQKED